jgi:hypothetical protein
MANEQRRPHEIFHDVVQIGVVVRDLDRTVQALTDIFGMGPFRVVDWPAEGRTDIERKYLGKPGRFTARMAFVDLGSVELEVIQPGEGDSIWADYLRAHGEGIHHFRFNTFDLASVIAYLQGRGIGVTQSGSGIRPGTYWANFDTEKRIGFTIEVMQALAGTSGRTPAIVGDRVEG